MYSADQGGGVLGFAEGEIGSCIMIDLKYLSKRPAGDLCHSEHNNPTTKNSDLKASQNRAGPVHKYALTLVDTPITLAPKGP